MTNFKNKIVGSGVLNPKEILKNPKNWRVHSDMQKEALTTALHTVGWVQEVIINKNTGRLVDGHLRVEMAIKNKETEIPVKYVDLTEKEEEIILATFDPISAMAEKDDELLNGLLEDIKDDIDLSAFDFGISDEDMENAGDDSMYTFKVDIPQYKITGECPSFDEMYDTGKTDSLIKDIESSNGITDEERAFLIEAAKRHTAFNYKNIAEYYAQATPEMQRLMEESALVIIDVHDAIRNGYAILNDDVMSMIEEESGKDDVS